MYTCVIEMSQHKEDWGNLLAKECPPIMGLSGLATFPYEKTCFCLPYALLYHSVVTIHFSSFAPLFTVLVAKYVFSIFQYCLETMLTAIVTMDRVLLLWWWWWWWSSSSLSSSLLLLLLLLAATAVFVMLCSMGLPPFNPGCHSGSPLAEIHNVYLSFILLNHFCLMSSHYLPVSTTKAFSVRLKIFL